MAISYKRSKSWWVSALVVVVVALLILVLRLVEEIGPEGRPGDRFTVTRVIDGDTMELRGGDRLRLLAIDTPEESEPFYTDATRLAAKLALGQVGRIEYAHRRRDLFVDTLFVNKAIIDSGYGYVYLFRDSDPHSDQVRLMLEAQRSAIERRVGLWSLPYKPEERYINKVGSFRLHRPNCRSLGELVEGRYQVFATREEGIATGLSPCRNCKP